MRTVFGEHNTNSMLYRMVQMDRENKFLLSGVDATEVRGQ